ncbi:MAG: HlyC/CorC family transporter [Acidobacteria bacterium]|nr:HlyC/CorC family transporter [Acidobacteriota bacterium]MCW5971236.1 HlyC/CorC family transporter [Blastocatellales bacterium]
MGRSRSDMVYSLTVMDPGSTIFSYSLRFGAVILLVLANGFFVAAEFALVGVRRSRIQTLADAGNRRATRLLGVLDHLDAYISATQLGITIASLALGWVGESTLSHIFQPVFASVLPATAAAAASHTAAIALAFALITFLHIVLGELAPKTLALQRAEAVALAITRPMMLFYRLFKAPIQLLNGAGNIVVRMIGLDATAGHGAIYTAEELHHLIDLSYKGGQLKPSQGAILARALEFSGLTVRYAMVPRTNVEAVSEDASLPDIVKRIGESGYSRLPVYRDTLDNIVGIIHSKEVLAFWDARDEFTVEKVMHPVNFVPDTMRLDSVLKRMQEGRFHFAVVTDEHGGFEGIITLEDLLEEIVGEIEDEFDDEAHRLVQKLPDGSYLLEGTLPIRSANRRLGLSLPEDGVYHTLAGFLMTQAGRVLRQGDRVAYGDAQFSIEKADRHRIREIRLILQER